MKKKRFACLFAAVMCTSMVCHESTYASCVPISADPNGSWVRKGNGWCWKNPNGIYAQYTWALLDGNRDGIAEYYTFDSGGNLVTDAPTAAGHWINSDGQLVIDGKIFQAPGLQTVNGYDESVLFAEQALELINNERVKAGMSKLRNDPTLTAVANKRAVECLSLFSHTRPNGTAWDTAFPTSFDAMEISENLAGGYFYPADIVSQWMSSPEHRVNILNPHFKRVGTVCIFSSGNVYWVQEFST